MPNKFMYVIDKTLAKKYQNEGFNLLQQTQIGDKPTWIFSITNEKDKNLNFESLDKSKVLFTNKLMF